MSRAPALFAQVWLAIGSDTVRLLGALATIGFLATAALPPAFHLSAICGRIAPRDVPDLLATGLFFPSISTLAIGWTAMILAMMPLLVVGPTTHVRHSTLPRRRSRATLLFGLSYGLCWTAAGFVLAPLSLLLGLVLGLWTAASLTLVTALCWSASPLAQLARNACHRRQRIGAFGAAADIDCVRQGVATGIACVGTCWPWMMLPLLADNAHLGAMVAVTVVVAVDRFSEPKNVCWRIPAIIGSIKIHNGRWKGDLRPFSVRST